jgi:hypothetical protein
MAWQAAAIAPHVSSGARDSQVITGSVRGLGLTPGRPGAVWRGLPRPSEPTDSFASFPLGEASVPRTNQLVGLMVVSSLAQF